MKFINPPALHDPTSNGYTHVVIGEAPTRVICIAGQGGEDVNGVLPNSFEMQVRQALANLQIALAAAGAKLTDVAKVTALVVDHDEDRLRILSKAMRGTWRDHPAPACTLIPVPRLALDDMLFEIDATVIV